MNNKYLSQFKKIKNVGSVFVFGNEIVITGVPDSDDEVHNCDAMGCNSVEHVLLRGQFRFIERGYDDNLQLQEATP